MLLIEMLSHHGASIRLYGSRCDRVIPFSSFPTMLQMACWTIQVRGMVWMAESCRKCSQYALDPNDLRDRLARVELQWHKVAKQRGVRAALRTIRRATGKPLARQSQTAGAVEAGRARKAA